MTPYTRNSLIVMLLVILVATYVRYLTNLEPILIFAIPTVFGVVGTLVGQALKYGNGIEKQTTPLFDNLLVRAAAG